MSIAGETRVVRALKREGCGGAAKRDEGRALLPKLLSGGGA